MLEINSATVDDLGPPAPGGGRDRPPPHTLLQLVVPVLFSRGVTLVLSLAFVLIAPNIIAGQYASYVYYTRLLAVFNLLLAIGSCGVINRFTRGLSEEGIDNMMGLAMSRKYWCFAALAIVCAAYGLGTGNYLWLVLLVIALGKAIGDAMVLLLYSEEQYRPRLYGQVLLSGLRLAALPVHALSIVLYIAAYELIAHVYTLYVFARTYPLHRLYRMLLARQRNVFAHVDKALHRKVELQTYQSNFLYFVLPLAPILIINNTTFEGVRDVSITYMIAIGVVYTLVSSINDVILPKLLRQKGNRRAITAFLLGSIGIATASLALLWPVFTQCEDVIVRHYDMHSYSSIYPFLIYSAALVVINSNRQVLYIYDRIGWLNMQLVLFYAGAIVSVMMKWPILSTLAGLSVVLTIATSATAFLFIYSATAKHD